MLFFYSNKRENNEKKKESKREREITRHNEAKFSSNYRIRFTFFWYNCIRYTSRAFTHFVFIYNERSCTPLNRTHWNVTSDSLLIATSCSVDFKMDSIHYYLFSFVVVVVVVLRDFFVRSYTSIQSWVFKSVKISPRIIVECFKSKLHWNAISCDFLWALRISMNPSLYRLFEFFEFP